MTEQPKLRFPQGYEDYLLILSGICFGLIYKDYGIMPNDESIHFSFSADSLVKTLSMNNAKLLRASIAKRSVIFIYDCDTWYGGGNPTSAEEVLQIPASLP